ncbi:MAG: FAD-binding protein [Alphaproteobacteria bacterium]|nr:FAD-binding protein [Alphaproteobacteria bacterium]
MDRIRTDIVISGGGVAGLAAAVAFGAAGFDVIVVDPAPPVTDAAQDGADLRTTAFLQPAKAFLDRAGLWEALAPYATALDVMRIVDAAKEPATTRDFSVRAANKHAWGSLPTIDTVSPSSRCWIKSRSPSVISCSSETVGSRLILSCIEFSYPPSGGNVSCPLAPG